MQGNNHPFLRANLNDVIFYSIHPKTRLQLEKLPGEDEDDFCRRITKWSEIFNIFEIFIMIDLPRGTLLLQAIVRLTKTFRTHIWIEKPIGGNLKEHRERILTLRKAFVMSSKCELDFNWQTNLEHINLEDDKLTINAIFALLVAKDIKAKASRSRIQKLPQDLIGLIGQMLIFGM